MPRINSNMDLKKAMIDRPDLNDFGIWTTQALNIFVEELKKEPTLFNFARVLPLSSESIEIPRMDFSGRLLYHGQDGVESTASQRKKVGITVQNHNTFIVKADIEVPYSVLEDLEGTDFMSKMRSVLNKAVARDLAELFWNGDTTISDTDPNWEWYHQVDGFLKDFNVNIYDFANNVIDDDGDTLASAYRTLPAEYRKNRQDLAFILSDIPYFDWQRTFTKLQTSQGDMARTEDMIPPFMGIRVLQDPMINTYLNGSDDNSKGLLTFPNNLILTVYKDITMRMIDKPEADMWLLHFRGRVGKGVDNVNAGVLLDNIKHKQ